MAVSSRLTRFLLGFCLLSTPLCGIAGYAPVASAAAPSPTTPLTLKSVRVEGNKAVSTEDILKAFGYHVGDKVSQVDLKGAQDRIGQLYTQRNVAGSLGEEMRMTGQAILVTIRVSEQAPSAAASQPQALVLDSVSFAGNKALSTDDLLAVTHLRAGQTVSDQSVAADESAIQAAYTKKGVSVRIQPAATYPKHDNHVVLVWQIEEK